MIDVFSCVLPGAGSVTFRIRPQVINLLVGDETPSYSFDRTGRLIGLFAGGVNYRRGLDNRVLAKWPGADGRQRRWLRPDEARPLLEAAYGLADRALSCLHLSDDVAGVEEALAVLRGWTWERLEADAAMFARIYRPVSILPPDQYQAVVVQATEGCSYNRCTFCDFYRDRPFRIKGAEELHRHIEEVAQFFGAGMRLRQSVFLADANALVAPMPRVREWFAVLAEALDAERLPGGGLFSFMDAFDVHRKSVAEWQELAAGGLRRVYIGMESGDDSLLRFLRKPGASGDVVAAVGALKAAGLAVSVIVMVGAGGETFAGAHVAGTAAALNAMPLGTGDIVYLSPFVEQPGGEYAAQARSVGIASLTREGMVQQEAGLRATVRLDGAQWARYEIREFVY